MVLQKKENESLSSLGRGKLNGGSIPWSCWPLLGLEENEWAIAGCRLLRPSIMNENAPNVTQLCRRACGVPGKLKARPVQHPATPALMTVETKLN
ncbi:hypothetical protein HanXRQr2_Chr05g0234291 [Helianthus annuus]|uniref:Uncharacterized protein n=1 Tax=Helianthus annuus TaxID=4232 RepID=A0A9K3J420_HELAN|nr:hypothetical protein HanXRQr2_Chr05g0234291 [Helianthus annuus]